MVGRPATPAPEELLLRLDDELKELLDELLRKLELLFEELLLLE
jgi:hypothetical protein